jgi:exodeoxyribonuclease VII large subunit
LLDTFRQRLAGLLRFRVNEMKSRLSALAQRRVLRMPWERLHDLARRLDEIEIRVHQAVRHREQTARERLFGMASRLQALSPLAVLLRGYSLTERLPDGKLVSNVSDLQAGDRMMTRFAHGRTVSLVEAILE